MTRTGEVRPPKAPDCNYHVFTTTPNGPWTEIAVIDAESVATTSLAFFRRKIDARVCEAGGDAVIVWMNGNGYYIKATVLASTYQAQPPAMASPGLQPVAPAEPQGCQYDTQCKGDRICIQGQCLEPKSSTNADDAGMPGASQ